MVDDTQGPGSQPQENGSSSLDASISLHSQRESHTFLMLHVQLVVAAVLSILFRRLKTSSPRHRQRAYACGLLEGGGMDKDASPHPTATHVPFSGVTLRYAVLASLATKGLAVAWMSLTQLGEGGWAAFSAGA